MPSRVRRFAENPIIHPGLDESIGTNINGPSLVRAPAWVKAPLGKYYLYFADHCGKYIRLAFADDLRGPWRIHRPGTLRLEQTCGHSHIASPDVRVDDAACEVRMYFHTVVGDRRQRTFLAVSNDALDFAADDTDLGPSYFRVFEHEGAHYAVAMAPAVGSEVGGGQVFRSPDGRAAFERGPRILPRQRHAAVHKRGSRLRIVFSRGQDCPERLLVAEMSLAGDWRSWRTDKPTTLLEPETDYEGGDLPLEPSKFGAAPGRVRQLRDPALFEDAGRTCLVYSCAGEAALALAELTEGP